MVAPGGPPIGGRYELGLLLATGGMGQVWQARDLLLGRAVAVKVLRSEYADDPTFRARFRAEAQHAALLAHRNIAAVFDYGEVSAEECGEHLAYLVMELVDGEPLSAVLAREGHLDVERTLDVLSQIAAGLAGSYVRFVPTGAEHTPLPLIVDLHGYSEPAALQTVVSSWDTFAATHPLVAVTPEITRPVARWNTALTGADLTWFGALLDRVEATTCIDRNRVDVDGYSDGAFFTSAIACRWASLLW